MSKLNIKNLIKSFPSMDRPAVNNVNLDIESGELVAFLGPSGCGKTTILKMITGLFQPDSGDIILDEQSLLKIPTEKRGVVMVFQNYLLFPYMNVNENVGFALKMKGVDKNIIDQKVKEMLELVKLPDIGLRKPKQLSGGQQQRVALARALISNPRILLLDEPLSNLDAHLRDEMRDLIVTIQQKLKVTTIFVTHDQEEAVPKKYYEKPKNIKAAKFFGGVNFINAKKYNDNLSTNIGTVHYKGENYTDLNEDNIITIRPKNIKLSKNNDFNDNSFKGLIKSVIFSGTHTRYKIIVNDLELECSLQSVGLQDIKTDDTIYVHLPSDKIWAMNE